MAAFTINQILRWLIQPKVWRYLCFASAVVGLTCYALSSSFNHLFGKWSLLKIFLYCVFSFIICLAILFAKSWPCSANLRLEAHLAFLVLIMTSVYSFFFDKLVNEKPDAYTLISFAAFAIMSLCLSRQTHFGFEVDLLYFFCGCLTVQLMKIRLLLVTVGASFSYFLIILRSSLDAHSSFGALQVQDQHFVTIQVDSVSDQTNSNIALIMQENDAATRVDSHSQQGNSDSDLINFEIGTRSLTEMQRRNNCILWNKVKKNLDYRNRNRIRVPSSLAESVELMMAADLEKEEEKVCIAYVNDIVIDELFSGMINDLHEIAKRMVAGGFAKECSHMYSSCRREFLEESLSRLGLQKLGFEDVRKMPWKELHYEIERWIKAFNVAFKILFPSERRLFDSVFFGFSSAANFSFTDVCCTRSTIRLLNFVKAVAIGSRSPERLFKIIDASETLRDLIPEFGSLFSARHSASLRNEANKILKILGEAIRGIFMELENLIRRDPVIHAVPGGGVHPVTRYVMNYLLAACRSWQTLEQVFEDYEHPFKEYPKLDDRVPSSSSLSMQMAWIMELLERNLEAKSNIYQDPALRYVFLMNNGGCIVQQAKDRELGTLLGDDWIRKHTAKVRQYHVRYQRSSWNKLLGFLKLDSNGSVPPNIIAESMKKKLKSFNNLFEDICRNQSSWVVFDAQHFRKEIIISLEKILLPPYGNFIARFRSVSELRKQADKCIKYGKEDIEAKLDDLFQGGSFQG